MKLWDSDILIRAVIEGTFKYLFLCVGKESEQQIKLQEYWEVIPEINRIKRHLKVQRSKSNALRRRPSGRRKLRMMRAR